MFNPNLNANTDYNPNPNPDHQNKVSQTMTEVTDQQDIK